MAVSPFSQRSKKSQMKGNKKSDPIDLEEDITTSQSPSNSQRFKNNAEKPSPLLTPKKSRKRRLSSSGRKSFKGKIPKMRTIDTYFKPVPKKIQCKNVKENKSSNRNELDIIIIEDDDYEGLNQFTGNVYHGDDMRQGHISVIDELHSLAVEYFQGENTSLTGKARTPIGIPTEQEISDTNTCAVTHEDLQDSHTKQVMESSPSTADKIVKNSTLSLPVNNSYDTQTTGTIDANNNTDSDCDDQTRFKLDAVSRQLIRDWCGGDTFLTQGSFSSSEEVTEQDDMNTDHDDNSDGNNFESPDNDNDKIDDDDDNEDDNGGSGDCDDNSGGSGVVDDDEDDNEDSIAITDPNSDKHVQINESDKSDEDSDTDSDDEGSSENDDDDDDDDDDDKDEDYVYNSEDESFNDDDYYDKKRKKRSFKRKK